MNNLRSFKVWAPLALAVTFALGMWLGKVLFTGRNAYGPADKINDIMRMVDERYVDEIDTDSLLEACIPTLMSKLDPHSVYISAADLTAVNSELEGSFSGIGISFNMLKDTIVVVEVISGGPSERVGLLPGDRIVTIDDSLATGEGWSTEKVMTRLRGEKDSVVKLGVKRSTSEELLPFEVTRGEIPVNTVDAAYMADETTGYIKVNKFGRTTANEFITALATLRGQGAEGFIVDLRGNGGGYMEMAVFMANEFLPANSLIVSTRGRNFDDDTTIFSDGTGSFQDAPVTVLLDEFSASASEIFAGAIQDNDRGLVIGRRSFGKGLVQQQYPLPDSSAIRLTISRYYTPSGRCIQKTFDRSASPDEYESELLNRFNHGEAYHADSIKLDTTVTYLTVAGRPVFGGGGIMPDIFVPNDTSGLTTYYLDVSNRGLIQKFSFDYFEKHRAEFKKAADLTELLAMLPTDTHLLKDFAAYAAANGVPQPFWYMVNQSRQPIVRNIKAAIARDVFGTGASFEIFNRDDVTINRALEEIHKQGTHIAQ